MNLFFLDEANKLNDDIKALMLRAFQVALKSEFKADEIDLEEFPIEVSVSIVTNDEIQNLNKEYRNIDKPTDVLSFPQFASKEEFLENISEDAENLLGDVVISYEKAALQAEEYGTGMTRELVYLFVHSVFHLLGYDHMEEGEKKEMRAREDSVMEELGL